MDADHNFYGRSSQILDGAASMVGNSRHARHTPTVKMTINGGPEHSNSGKGVCADCYFTSTPPFLLLWWAVFNIKQAAKASWFAARRESSLIPKQVRSKPDWDPPLADKARQRADEFTFGRTFLPDQQFSLRR